MNIFVILILLLISINIEAGCSSCKVKFAQVHPMSQSTQYSGNLEDGTLVHVTETKPTAGTISGKKIVTKTVKGKMTMEEQPLSEQEAVMYKQAIAQEAGK